MMLTSHRFVVGQNMLQYHQVFFAGSEFPVSGFEVVQSGGATWLVASLNGGGMQLTGQITGAGASLGLAGSQMNVGSASVLSGPVGGNHLFALSPFGGALQLAEVQGTGQPGAFSAVIGSSGLGITAVEMLADDADPLVLASNEGGAALGVFRIDGGTNALSAVGPSMRPESLEDNAITDIALATVGSMQVAVVVSAAASTVSTVQVSADGTLVELDQAGVKSGVGIGQPTSVLVIEVSGKSFALVSATATSSITVFEITLDGGLRVTDQINDSATTRFANLAEAEVLEMDGRIFVALAGTDGGVTVMQMLEDGTLHAHATYANTGFDLFGQISDLEMFATGTTLNILTSGSGSSDLHHFSLDTTQLGDVVLSNGTGIAQGGALNDILIAQDSTTQLTGGQGADTFVFDSGADTVVIQDYAHGVDTIDLSYWPRVFDINALGITELSDGIRFEHAGRVLTIRTDDGQPLEIEDFSHADLFALWRLPIEEQTVEDPTLDWDGALSLRLGSDLGDVLFGTSDDEVLVGMQGADELNGFVGTDILDGGSGADLLTGGAGRDVFVFDDAIDNGGDMVSDYEGARFDIETGTLVGDIVFFSNASAGTPVTTGMDVTVNGVRLDVAAQGNVLVATSTAQIDNAVWGNGINAALGAGQIPNLRATLTDVDGDESYDVMDITFDSGGQVQLATAYNDNGTETRYLFDTPSSASWARLVETFNAQGQLIQRETSLDSGAFDLLLLDPDNVRTWSQIDESMDAQGRQTEYIITYDSGDTQRTLTDVDNDAVWNTILEFRNENGQLDDKRTNYNDGSQLRIVTDVMASQSWSSIRELRDADARIYDKRTDYDAGGQQRLVFDVAESAGWDLLIEQRDENGQMFDKRTRYDAGGEQRQAFDVTDNASWDVIIEFRDDAGNLVDKRTEFDDGWTTLLQFDVGDTAAWDLIVSGFDVDGSLQSRRTENDDGTTLLRLFDVAGTESWDVYTRLFDEDGTLLSESFL